MGIFTFPGTLDTVVGDPAGVFAPDLTPYALLASPTFTGVVTVAAGTAGAPSVAFGEATSGGFRVSAGVLGLSAGGTEFLRSSATQATFAVPALLPAGTAALPSAAIGNLSCGASFAGAEGVTEALVLSANATEFFRSTYALATFAVPTTVVGAFTAQSTANAATVAIKTLTEETTIAAAATTDTTIQVPAGAIVIAVQARVTTVIPTAAAMDIGIAGATTRYLTAGAVTAGATSRGTDAGLLYYATATAIRITPDAQPGDTTGRVRVTIWYIESTPPTS